MGSVPSPQTPRQLPLHKSLTFERPAPGPGSKESLDGDGEPGAAGRHPPGLAVATLASPPTCYRVAPASGSASRCGGDPTCSGEVPGETSRGFLPPGGASGRKPGVEGFGLHTCNSWMSQK